MAFTCSVSESPEKYRKFGFIGSNTKYDADTREEVYANVVLSSLPILCSFTKQVLAQLDLLRRSRMAPDGSH